MKSPLFLLSAFFSFFLLSLADQPDTKSVIVHYPKDTPDHIINAAMKAVKNAGGLVTHQYNIFKYAPSSTHAYINVFKGLRSLRATSGI
jgi:hypothetical protein